MSSDHSQSTSARIRALPGPGSKFGPYEVVGPLGRGGMGLVLHARDASGRDLALKLLTRQIDDMRILERFRREAQVTASLRHVGIVAVHDTGIEAGWPYITYEYVPGGRTLEDLFAEGDPQASTRLVLEAAEGLGHAHANGIIHRDVKAANVLVSPEGHARVADFGLAQAIGLERLTHSGALVGTPSNMAPEQIVGERERYGPPTDVWALGTLLYRALTGRRAFEATTMLALGVQITGEEPPPPRSLNPRVSPALEAVCLKALRKAPEARYSDGASFAADLRAALEKTHVHAMDERRGRRVALAAAILAATALAGGAAAVSHRNSGEATPAIAPTAVDRQEARRVERVLRRLEPVLARLGEIVDPAQALAEFDSEELALPAARDRLLEAQRRRAEALHAALEVGSSQRDLIETQLRALAALRGYCGAAPFPGANQAADKLLRLGCEAPIGLWDRYPESLVLLAQAGGRAQDRALGDRWTELLYMGAGSGQLPPEHVQQLLLGLARLDVGWRAGLQLQRLEWAESATPTGSEPWERYLRLRIQCQRVPSKKMELACAELQRLWEEPPAGFEPGPVQLAELACLASLQQKPKARLAIVERGLRLDPGSPALLLSHAKTLALLNRHAEASGAYEAAEASWEAHDFHNRALTQDQRRELQETRLFLAAAAEDRDLLETLLVEIWGEDSGAKRAWLGGLGERFPWILEAYPTGE